MRAQGMWRFVMVLAAAGCIAPLTNAADKGRFGSSACVARTEPVAPDACERLAREISADINAVRALGDELEQRERYEDAATAYRVALTMHPDHRDLLQRLIRARGQARSTSLVAGEPPKPPALTATALPAPSSAPTSALAQTRNSRAATSSPGTQSTLGTAITPGNVRSQIAQPSLRTDGRSAEIAGAAQVGDTRAQQPAQGVLSAATPNAQARNSPSRASKQERPRAVGLGAPSGRYLALVIGNEQYADFTKLKTPLADVQALAGVLTRDYGFDVQVLANATRYQIVSALSRLRQQATENDSVLIYYAGHGYLDQATSRGYWLPVDAEHDNLGNWLSTSDITDVLAGLQARHALILADSCFSGTLLRGELTVSIDERQSMLRKLSAQRSRSIMTSGGLEPVIDDGPGKHSIFAGAVIKALRDNRQFLEAGRLFMQIRDQVSAHAAQTPQYAPLRNAGHDGGDFIFVRQSKK